MKQLCVFPPHENREMGDRVFFYNEVENNEDFVRVYEFEDDRKWIMILHKSKIVTVCKDMCEQKFGALYLQESFSQFK